MRFLLLAMVTASTLMAGCAVSPCERLTDELCTARGEDNARCQTLRTALDDRSRLGDLQCKRSLFLYQGEGGRTEQ